MKKCCVAVIVASSFLVSAGVCVLVWYLVTSGGGDGAVSTDGGGTDSSGTEGGGTDGGGTDGGGDGDGDTWTGPDVETITLDGVGFGTVEQRSYVTNIRGAGGVFWWFYPAQEAAPAARPLVLWLDGVTGLPPSLAANVAMFGPYDHNMNSREDSWINDYNLLFVDAPLGTGFSTAEAENISGDLEQNAEHLVHVLEAFYLLNEEFRASPLHVVGQAQGAQLALALVEKLQRDGHEIMDNIHSVVLGNPIVYPSLVLTKIGFYLEELGYIYRPGRITIEALADEIQQDVEAGDYGSAFDKFLSVEQAVNDVGSTSVNSGHIVEKLTTDDNLDTFSVNQRRFLERGLAEGAEGTVDLYSLMEETVAPALGLAAQDYDSGRPAALQAFRDTFMIPVVDKVEYLLENTNITVAIYNGNLDAISNTPGQLEWVNNLQWSGQEEFLAATRQPLVFNYQIEGYFRESPRLRFYWVNVAGLWGPLDNPVALRRVLARTFGN